jgi:hypothetical protein
MLMLSIGSIWTATRSGLVMRYPLFDQAASSYGFRPAEESMRPNTG